MQYMLLIYHAEGAGPAPGTPEFDEMMNGYRTFTQDIKSKGVMVAGDPLEEVVAVALGHVGADADGIVAGDVDDVIDRRHHVVGVARHHRTIADIEPVMDLRARAILRAIKHLTLMIDDAACPIAANNTAA